MKFPKKLWPLGLGFIALGLLASASALAAAPASSGGTVLPRSVGQLPAYMITASGLNDAAYMDCIKAGLKPAMNPVAEVQVAINCGSMRN